MVGHPAGVPGVDGEDEGKEIEVAGVNMQTVEAALRGGDLVEPGNIEADQEYKSGENENAKPAGHDEHLNIRILLDRIEQCAIPDVTYDDMHQHTGQCEDVKIIQQGGCGDEVE